MEGVFRMHLVRHGSGDPILFIHGFPTNSRLWSGIIERLSSRHTCFAIDLPGLGKSPAARYGPRYLQLLAQRIDRVREEHGIDKWHVVGHDAGAAIAVHYAREFQPYVNCMSLLSPALFPELRPYFLFKPLRKPVLGEMLAPFINVLFWKIAMHRALESWPDGQQIVKDFYKPFSGFAGAWEFMRIMRWGDPAELLADVPSFLPQLQVPTLIFQGSRDTAVPASFAHRASALIPNSTLVTLDSGHFIPLSQPESVAAKLARFFEQQSTQRALPHPA
jgi:pimeloyl-ACP methyl ester carboxylesterase